MSGKVNLDRWGPHLAAAKRKGVSLAQYARIHGLSRYTLYDDVPLTVEGLSRW